MIRSSWVHIAIISEAIGCLSTNHTPSPIYIFHELSGLYNIYNALTEGPRWIWEGMSLIVTKGKTIAVKRWNGRGRVRSQANARKYQAIKVSRTKTSTLLLLVSTTKWCSKKLGFSKCDRQQALGLCLGGSFCINIDRDRDFSGIWDEGRVATRKEITGKKDWSQREGSDDQQEINPSTKVPKLN